MATSRQQRRAAERDTAKRLKGSKGSGPGPMVWAISGILLVLLAVAVLVAVKASQGGSSAAPTNTTNASGASPASPALIASMSAIPASAFNTVGYQGTPMPTATSAKQLTIAGKPAVLYIGAEFCPYCAAERWALVAALSRFGTFHKLSVTHSSSTDVDPNTNTFSFHGSAYTSPYLTFSPSEVATNIPSGNYYTPLDKPTAAQTSASQKYDSNSSIPFISFANQYVSSGATYDPGILAGMSYTQIAAALKDPTSDVAKAALSSANGFAAAICKTTGGQPANVCSSSGVQAAAAHLGK
jgi:hypothetical protein